MALGLGVVGGPLSFALVRLAGIALLAGTCGQGDVVGLTPSVLMGAITVVCAALAAGTGLVSWSIWHRTRDRLEARTAESQRFVPFWALGGMFLSGTFLVFIVLSGILALALGTNCSPA